MMILMHHLFKSKWNSQNTHTEQQTWGQIRFFKYKYKYASQNSFKYKYKYKYGILKSFKYKYNESNTNTNTAYFILVDAGLV